MSARRRSHDLTKRSGQHMVDVGAMSNEGGGRHRVVRMSSVGDDDKVIKS